MVIALATGCSTKKNTGLNRFWHKTNTHYNGWFNGNEAIKVGQQELTKSRRDDYNKIIPVFDYGDRTNWPNMNSASDRAIKKAVVMIKKHSMLINGKQYNKWIDDCYLLLGKAHFFKIEHPVAVGQLRHVSENSEKEYTRNEAKIWMIKAYNEMGEFAESGTVIRQVDKGSLGKLEWQYHAAVADYYIKQKEWDKAIGSLDEAIRTVKSKKKKARFEFVKGQVYQQMKNNPEAYRSFATVLKNKPEYELEFQSKINMAKTSENQSNEDLRKLLKKMLRDGKNVEYLDQIYFAMAIVDLKENKKEDAIVNLRNSIRNNTDNKNQKAFAYLELAQIYFADKLYEPAQGYYDSTAVFLDKDHPQYEEVLRLRDNLTEVVTNIRTVELQDSLQRLGRMSEPDLTAFLEDYVADLKEKDEEAKNNPDTNPISFTSTNTQGKWYFYNQQALTFGANDFRKVWGSRPLEDDWRRSDKGSNMFADNTAEDTAALENPRYDISTYLAEIPRTDSAYAASNTMIYDALYNLGLVYKEKIYDYPRSAEAFEDLVARNTDNSHFPVTYYQLYLVYNMMKDEANATKYKNIIIQQYPESEYAQLLSNPGYVAVKDGKEDAAEPLYNAAYQQYKDGWYEQCISSCSAALQQYPDTRLAHRFALLSALCTGKLHSTDTFVVALEAVKTGFPGTESALTADRLLKYLKDGGTTSGTNGPTSITNNTLAPQNPFVYDSKAEHMLIVVVEDPAKRLDIAMAGLAGFNDKSFPLKKLNVSNTLLGKKYQVLSVRKFADANDAMNYYRMLTEQSVVEQMNLNVKTYTFPISVANYGLLFKQQNVADYDAFFRKNYIVSN